MDILLAIDCSLRWTNVAVISGEIKAALNADIGRRQAAELPLIVEKILDDAKVEKNKITHVGVTIGPGYFTGVRIGMAFAAAFAFGIGARVVPVGTLDALMYGQDPNSVCLVYAGKGKVYASCEKLRRGEYSTNEILELVPNDAVFFSDQPEKIEFFPKEIEKIFPQAENVALLAWEKRVTSSISPQELRADWCKNPV